MKRMIWKAECRMGNNDIDAQHRLLYAIANELIEIENPQNQEPEIKYLLRHLKDYVDTHFKYEEQFMEKHKYPNTTEHKQKHSKIVNEIKEALLNSRTLYQVKDNLENLMISWIQSHIMIEDKKLFDWAKLHKLV